jgi:hypothetical protein
MVVLILISIALLVWGFVSGFETSTHEVLPPTNALLTWAAIMIGIAIFCWIVVGLIVNVKNDPKSLVKMGIVLVGLVALCLVAAGLSLWLPREAAARRVSDLYRRYEPNPHLSVAFIEGFKVNDTLAVDVTTVTALDDEGWDTLRADFRIRQLPEHTQNKIDSGQDIVSVRIVLKSNPAFPMDTVDMENNVVVGISRLNRVVSIFNTDTEKQIDAILHYNYEKNIQTNK